MSGGTMNYFYCTLQEYSNELKDPELNEMMNDIVNLYHDREWYDSGDTSKGDWLHSMNEFKKKWFGEIDYKRIEKLLEKKRKTIYESLGIYDKCCECKHWEKENNSKFGYCPKLRIRTTYYEAVCQDNFERR